MPPRKRVVRATRRTPKSTPKSKSQTPSTPPPDPEPASPPSSSAAVLDLESTHVPAPIADVVEPPAATLPSPDIAPAGPVAVTEAVEAEPVEAEPTVAADEELKFMVEEPPVVAADEVLKPSEEPPAAEAPAAVKTNTRVRKVVKKKIIVRKVPKGTLTAAATAPKEEDMPQEVVDQNPNPNLQPGLEPQKCSSHSDAPSSMQPEVALEPEKHEEAPAAAQMEEEKEVVVTPMEEDEAEQKEEAAVPAAAGDEEKGISERRRRRKTEIFIGGLDRDAKEEDIRKVFGTIGEIVEVRMMMDSQTGKNKGYAFLRYAEATHAKKAVKEFVKVEVCSFFYPHFSMS